MKENDADYASSVTRSPEASDSSPEAEDVATSSAAVPSSSSRSSRTRQSSTLGKGRACLRCRGRKIRCDGKRPCSSCGRLNRECKYEEERSRTQKLLDKIEGLEEHLLQLENSQTNDSPKKKSPNIKEEVTAPSEVSHPLVPPCFFEGDALLTEAKDFAIDGEWWNIQLEPPAPIQSHLIAICISQRARPALHLHLERFYESLLNPSETNPKPLPGLLNAMYLIGCNLSNDPNLMSLEPLYLDQTRQLLAEELTQADVPLIQWLQASCLVAFYLHRVGRFLEARNELSGLTSLIVACDLHKIRSSKWTPVASEPTPSTPSTPGNSEGTASKAVLPNLPPPRDGIDLGERIGLFWMVYMIDQITALVCGLPPDSHLFAETETVWPKTFADIEMGTETGPEGSIRSLFGPNPTPPFDPPCSLYTLRLKAVALLAHVSAYATSLSPERMQGPEFKDDFEQYDYAIAQFLLGIPSITFDPSADEIEFVPALRVNISLFMSHTMALLSFVHLYGCLDEDTLLPAVKAQLETQMDINAVAQRRLQSCRQAIALLRMVLDAGVPFPSLPTTCGFAWCAFAKVLAQYLHAHQLEPSIEHDSIRLDLEIVMIAIAGMSAQYPIIGYQLDRIRELCIGLDPCPTMVSPTPEGTDIDL